MRTHDENHSLSSSDEQGQLYDLACTYQDAVRAWMITTDARQRTQLLQEQATALEQLYKLLAEPLRRLVSGWRRSQQFSEVMTTRSYREAIDSLALSSFGDIAAALTRPTCRLQREKNVRGFLIQIARYGLSDQERSIYRQPYTSSNQGNELIQSGEPAAAMWWLVSSTPSGVWEGHDTYSLAEPEDTQTAEFEYEVIQRLDDRQLWQAIWHTWRTTLADEEWQIVSLRWLTESLMPFDAIAEQLGPGWTAATVRQRHHRIVQRARQHLNERGLLERPE